MCRIRFGVDGIYFEELQPSRFREEYYQPLISNMPDVYNGAFYGDNRPSDFAGKQTRWTRARVLPESLDKRRPGKDNIRKDINHITHPPSSTSSSSSDDDCRPLLTETDIRKRSRQSSSSSSSSDSDGHRHGSAKDKQTTTTRTTKSSQSKKPVLRDVHQTQSGRIPVSVTSKTVKGPPVKRVRFSKASSPEKKVRFADMIEEKRIVNDDANDDDSESSSSSNSTYDSYIDPPSPIEPYDVFSGYYRSPGVSQAYRNTLRQKGRSSFGMIEWNGDTHGYLDASDGSGIDADNAAVSRPRRRIRPGSNFYAIPSSRGRSPASQSWVSGSEIESNIDDVGEDPATSRFHRQRSLSPLVPSKRLRDPKIRSTKPVPEPVFVVRSKVQANTQSTRNRPNDLRRTANVGGETNLREEYEARKAARLSPASDRDTEKDKTRKYKPPSVSDDVESESEVDLHTGVLFRDV